MENLNKVIEELVENFGFSFQRWDNYNEETIFDIVNEIKDGLLYSSFTEIYPNIEPEIKPKEFILLEKIIDFNESFEFESFKNYVDYINKISNLVNRINNIPHTLIENVNNDFHYLAFIFPTS